MRHPGVSPSGRARRRACAAALLSPCVALLPQRVVISDRGLKAGTVELQGRREAAASVVPLAEVAPLLKARLRA